MSGTDANDRDAARPATESDVRAPGALGDVPPVSGAGLRARLEAEVEQAWESSSHWKARAERLQELRGTAEDRVSDLAEELSRFRADVEALADDWDLYDEPCGETLRATLAEPAEATASRPPETSGAGSIAPVAAEEGGEQEAGEAACEHCEVRRLIPDAIWACVACGIEFDPPPFEDGHPAPSGSDELGNRPATPDANGGHDTKGGE